MVRMKDEHVVSIVDDTMACRIEFTNDMDVGLWSTWRVEPCLS